MARIPIIQGNSVQLAPLARQRLQAPDATGGLDSVARGLGVTGQALSFASEEQDLLDEQIDNAGAKTLDVEARGQIGALLGEFSGKTGLNAGAARPDIERRIGEVRSTIIGKATTPRMARMLGEALDLQVADAFGKVTVHAAKETAAAEKTATGARATALGEAAIAATSPAERDRNLFGALTEVRRLGELNGDAPEVIALAEMTAESAVHGSVITSLIDADNLDAAVEYEDANSARMIDADRSRVRKIMLDPLQDRQAVSDAGGIIAGLPSPDAAAMTPGKAATVAGASIDGVFQALLMQESGNRAGAVGPPTQWGRAYGAGQVLDGTAQGVAKKLGVAWRPDLMRAKSAEGYAYQTKISRAYFEEGLAKHGGDIRKALMFYHGGPDQKRWGPKTRAYADNIMARVGGGSAAVPAATARRWDVQELYARADAAGEEQGWSPERLARAKREVDRVVDRDEQLLARSEREAERGAYDAIDQLPDNRLTSMAQLPADVRANLSPQSRIRLEGEIERNTRPREVEANGDVAVELNVLAASDPQVFLREDLRAYRGQLTPSEYESLRVTQARIQQKPREQTPHSRVWGTINRFAPDVGLDLGTQGGKPRKPEDRRDAMALFSIMQGYLNFLTEGKRAPTDDEIKRAFDNAVMPVRNSDGEGIPRFRATDLPTNSVAMPESVRRRIAAGLRAAGLPTDNRTITRVYVEGDY